MRHKKLEDENSTGCGIVKIQQYSLHHDIYTPSIQQRLDVVFMEHTSSPGRRRNTEQLCR